MAKRSVDEGRKIGAMSDRIHKADLDMLLERARTGRAPEMTAASLARLVEEIRRLRAMLIRAYPHVHDDATGHEIHVELEREIRAISDEGGV